MNVKQTMKSNKPWKKTEKPWGTDNAKVLRSYNIKADWVLKHTALNSHDMDNGLLHCLEGSSLDVARKKLFSSFQGWKLCQMKNIAGGLPDGEYREASLKRL